ncbi:MAG: DJ-1/PfpI family protein [Candidatus Paceibacterota bacterium]|jgi:protease I
MKKWVIFIVSLVVIFILFSLFLPKTLIAPHQNLNKTKMKDKILAVIAFRDFRDEEYFVPKEILENAGYEVETASTKKGIALGINGGEAEAKLLPSEVKVDDYQAIVFVGGAGMAKELENKNFWELAQIFVQRDKLVAAICISPAVLAKAGVLKNKKATVWTSPLDKSAVQVLENNGAVYEDKAVVQDGKIITANGPAAAQEFGEKIVEALNK